MDEEFTEMSGTFPKNSPRNRRDDMGTITYSPELARNEAANLVREIAGQPDRPVKGALDRARTRLAPYLRVGLNRIEELWYGQVRLIRAEEMDALRAAAEARRRKLEAGRAAANELADLYLGVAERLRQVDEDMYGPEITRLERQAGGIRSVAGPGAKTNSVKPSATQSTEGGE